MISVKVFVWNVLFCGALDMRRLLLLVFFIQGFLCSMGLSSFISLVIKFFNDYLKLVQHNWLLRIYINPGLRTDMVQYSFMKMVWSVTLKLGPLILNYSFLTEMLKSLVQRVWLMITLGVWHPLLLLNFLSFCHLFYKLLQKNILFNSKQ